MYIEDPGRVWTPKGWLVAPLTSGVDAFSGGPDVDRFVGGCLMPAPYGTADLGTAPDAGGLGPRCAEDAAVEPGYSPRPAVCMDLGDWRPPLVAPDVAAGALVVFM
mmetsp:Transcript_142695/g.355684  ORF Transcript_142695/g.355684 Transcript_142695/m.355684 type:complete len:106 (+) Transcript_142695:123-440(+)